MTKRPTHLAALALTGLATLAPWAGVATTSAQQPTGASSGPQASAPGALSLVGLGDSLPGALGCELPCRSYVDVYGDLAAAALGRTVTVTNLATNDELESGGLLARVRSDARHRDAIADADVITLQIGLNDWQGSCMFEGLVACLSTNAAAVNVNVAAILDEIVALRAGRPTLLRLVTYFDPYVGAAKATEWWGFAEPDRALFEEEFGAELSELNDGLCLLATAHDGLCVDTRTPINGPGWDSEALPEPAAGALVHGGDDHLHLTAAGHALVAQAIADLGFAPIS